MKGALGFAEGYWVSNAALEPCSAKRCRARSRRTGAGRYPVQHWMGRRTRAACPGGWCCSARGFWIPACAGMTDGWGLRGRLLFSALVVAIDAGKGACARSRRTGAGRYPVQRSVRQHASALDSGLRRNDEWVGLAVGGLGAGQRRSVADRRATGGRAIRRLSRRSERGRDDRRPLPDGRGRRFHAMTSGRAKRSCRVPLGQRRGRRRCGAAPSRV